MIDTNKIEQYKKALSVTLEAIQFGSKLNSYSDAVNTRYECIEALKKIDKIMELDK